jgi:hypothetical protein
MQVMMPPPSPDPSLSPPPVEGFPGVDQPPPPVDPPVGPPPPPPVESPVDPPVDPPLVESPVGPPPPPPVESPVDPPVDPPLVESPVDPPVDPPLDGAPLNMGLDAVVDGPDDLFDEGPAEVVATDRGGSELVSEKALVLVFLASFSPCSRFLTCPGSPVVARSSATPISP